MLSVAALDSNRRRPSFSQFIDQVEISGPGVLVQSTYRGGTYRSLSSGSFTFLPLAIVISQTFNNF